MYITADKMDTMASIIDLMVESQSRMKLIGEIIRWTIDVEFSSLPNSNFVFSFTVFLTFLISW